MGMTQLFVSPAKTFPGVLPRTRNRKKTNPRKLPRERKIIDTLTVGGLMDSIKPTPKRSLLLGKCVDGLPFLIEMGDPDLGAILITCDSYCGKTHHLQVMVDSAVRTFNPHEFQAAVLTLNPAEWSNMLRNHQQKRFLQGCYAWYDDRAVKMIENLTELAEERLEGKQQGAAILLVLDDLTAVEDLPMDAQVNLRWLLEYGPQSSIWVVGTMDARQIARNRYWVEPFRTQIIGRVEAREDLDGLGLQNDHPRGRLAYGEFRVRTGASWLGYRLPLLGNLRALEV